MSLAAPHVVPDAEHHHRQAERDALVQAHVGLVHFLARRLHASLADDAELDELVSAGMVGLLRAAEGFDPARGLAFTTLATPRVRGAMLDELRRLDRLSRTARARVRALHHARNALSHGLGRLPDAAEMAHALSVDVHTFWRWQDEVHSAHVVTLDHGNDDDTREGPSLSERIPDPDFDLDIELDRERERERLIDAMRSLPPDERQVLSLSYFEEMTLQEIAPTLGITESGASRIRTRALRRLRRHLGARRAA